MAQRGTVPLANVRVLDVSERVSGAYCAKLLHGFGATVVRAEPADGSDPIRSTGPFVETSSGRQSIRHLWLNTGKLSYGLAAERERRAAQWMRLGAWADVIIESFQPGGPQDVECGFDRLQKRDRGLIRVSITPFGRTGPRAAWAAEDATLYALGGAMALTGDAEREPLAAGPAVAEYDAGIAAYTAALVALWARAEHGLGDWIDVSIQEAVLDTIEIALVEYLHEGRMARRRGDRHPMVPWQLYDCADGRAAVLAGPVRRWLPAVKVFEEPGLLAEHLRTPQGRGAHREEVEGLLEPWIRGRRREELFHLGQRHGLAFGYLADLDEVLRLPQHEARGFFRDVPLPGRGTARLAGPPFSLDGAPWRDAPAPELGEHQGAVEARCAEPRPETRIGRTGAGRRPQPLARLRVLDLTHYWSGPHAVRVLADLGAEVTKVEYPGRLCGFRGAKLTERAYDQWPRWHQMNRNKKSITLDLDRPVERRIFEDLVTRVDVVVDNSRAPVLRGRGLGPDELRSLNPRVVVASFPAFGSTGPFASYGGYGGSLEPMSGIQELTAYERDGRRYRVREADSLVGAIGAAAILTALHQARQSGAGCCVEMAQLEAMTSALIGEHLLEYALLGNQSLPSGNRSTQHAPRGCYPCREEDGWVVVCARSDDEWRRLCALLGRRDLANDARLARVEGRRAAHDEIDRAIGAWTAERSAHEAMDALQDSGVCAAAVASVAQLARDPHLRARGYFFEDEDGLRYPGPPFQMASGGARLRARGPDLGAHNREIVGGWLGRPEVEVPQVDESALGSAADP